MKRQFWALAAVGALALNGCASDPTSSLSDAVSAIDVSARTARMNVGDSVVFTARSLDGHGNTATTIPTASSDNTAIITVTDVSLTPLSQASFSVKGVSYGVANVLVTSAGVTDTITVTTYPASVAITGAAANDTLGSGSTLQLATDPMDAAGNSITVNDLYEWESSDASVLSVDSTGLLTAKAPGSATITVTAPGGADKTIDLVVAPGTFSGTFSATSGNFGDTLVIKPGAVAWDGDEEITFDGSVPWIVSQSTDSIVLLVPGTASGTVEALITKQGAGQVASAVTFTVGTGYAAHGDPAAAPNLTAGPYPQEFFVQLSNDTPDDFFDFTPGGDLDITVTISWQNADGDIDILWCDAGCNNYVGNFDGASSANPESSSVTVPAGTTYLLWLNKYDTDIPNAMIKVTITSP